MAQLSDLRVVEVEEPDEGINDSGMVAVSSDKPEIGMDGKVNGAFDADVDLGPGDQPAPTVMDLLFGSTGELVRDLQVQLRKWGFDPGTVGGVYDENTADAVRALQRKLGIAQSGRIDKDTRNAIQSDLSNPMSVLKAHEARFSPSSTALTVARAGEKGASAPGKKPMSSWQSTILWILAGAGLLYIATKQTPLAEIEIDDDPVPTVKKPKKRKKKAAKVKASEAIIDAEVVKEPVVEAEPEESESVEESADNEE